MVLNSMLLVRMAETSAEIWQHIACLPETINSHELIDLVLCFPLQQLGRFALCFWTFFCVPPPPLTHSSYLLYHSNSSNSASNSDSDADSDFDYQQRYYYHDSHSD